MGDVAANPVLAEVIRSGFVESRHRGTVVALAADGTFAFTAGIANAPVFPRSSNKPLQAAAMIRAGLPLDGEKSCSDLNAPLLVVSQFTLYADTAKGRRPSWNNAAPGPVAEPLVDAVVAELRALGARVETGKFGADMKVALVNDGPVTIIIEL